MILKAEKYSAGVLNRETYVYTFIKIIIVFFEKQIEEMVCLME